MIERTPRSEEPAGLHGGGPVILPVNPTESLEQRVRQLEESVATLQNPTLVEDRIIERVSERMGRLPSPPREAAGVILDAGPRPLPAAVGLLNSPGDGPPEPPNGPKPATGFHSWVLYEAYTEARAMIDMYLDPRYRYRLTWTARVVPVVLLALILSSWFWLPGTAILP